MKVVIVGGGASGILSALAVKDKHPIYDVLVIDKNNKLGKKLRATGNGKCMMCNTLNNYYYYQDEKMAKKLLTEYGHKEIISFFNRHHIMTVNHDGYVYPYSESANMLTDTLINECKKLGVKFISETKAIDYKNNVLITDKGKYQFDKLIIASGLKSQSKLGADASFVINLKNHGYKIESIIPVLVPVKTVESTKEVNGIRNKVHAKLMNKNQLVFEEDGELLFKKDGLSGIVIQHLGTVSVVRKLANPRLVIDFLPNVKFNGHYEDYFVSSLVNYLRKKGNPKEVVFNIKGYYDENDSVASTGGVSLNNVNDYFESKLEKNVYIVGEALNQLGLCGGYNLMWAFATALKVSDHI